MGMPYIEVIQPELAEGQLKGIYEDLIRKRGKLAEVHKIQSLNPPTIVRHMDLYMSIMFGRSPLSREERELIGVVVSQANGCVYCQVHHAEALNHFWKDDPRIRLLLESWKSLELTFKEKLLCTYAWELTLSPEKSAEAGLIRPLKESGLNDRTILDATLVIGYFNFVNRIVLALGVELEKEPGGYGYE